MAAGTVVYDIDQRTGQPLRLTISSDQPALPALHRPAIRSKTVLTFSVYEKLPVTKANRKLLALRSHPGPGTQAPSEVFAALRTGAKPDAATLAKLGRFAKDNPEFQLELAGTRALAEGVYILPGKGFVCLSAILSNGSGVNCRAIRSAARSGLSMGTTDRLLIVVPDGVKAVKARANARHPWRTVPIKSGFVRLPYFGYRWRLVR
jgi:hypothetical protein